MEISNIIIDLSGDWQFEMRLSSIENCREEIQQNKDRLTAYLDRSIFSGDLLIRSWEHGDRFRPLGMNGQKVKLTDFWIDRKIPRRARDKWPLVIADGEIAWIPGFHPSHEFRVRETTRKILVMNLRRKS
jgi:tRNA(Ile)-lysidine synthase